MNHRLAGLPKRDQLDDARAFCLGSRLSKLALLGTFLGLSLIMVASAQASSQLAVIGQVPLLSSGPSKTKFVGLKRRIKVAYGSSVTIRGRLKNVKPGERVSLQTRHGRHWSLLRHSTVRSVGRFRFRWKPKAAGSRLVRVRFVGNVESLATQKMLRVKVLKFRIAQASYYELFGNRTACGQTLTSGTVGVANKTLPCGTKVVFASHGRTVTAPVIDRGPYVAGREFDLTVGLKNKLGFGSTGPVKYTVQ